MGTGEKPERLHRFDRHKHGGVVPGEYKYFAGGNHYRAGNECYLNRFPCRRGFLLLE
jgi:hypothetical protein